MPLRRVSPHQRAAALFQASTADFSICTFISVTADAARAGSLMRRSQTVRSARTTSAQSTGITLLSGLAFHIRSIELSIGSLASMSVSWPMPAFMSPPVTASGTIIHGAVPWRSAPCPAGPPTWPFIQADHTPSIASGENAAAREPASLPVGSGRSVRPCCPSCLALPTIAPALPDRHG
jgi:hypothetical protein